MKPKSPWIKRLTLAAVGALLLAVGYLDGARIGAHALTAPPAGPRPSAHGHALGLAAYTATIEARPIQGLSANVSGLSYSHATGTLFVVINRPAAVAEITTDGHLLRRLSLPRAMDPEGISHVEGDLFIVSDEADNRLHWVRIRPGAQAAQVDPIEPLALDFSALHNLGLEGASWDDARDELLLANEKWPRRVLAVQGLAPPGHAAAAPPVVRDVWPAGRLAPLGSDLSSLTVHPRSGNLLLLSDESATLSEYSRTGQLLGVLPLWPGQHGLRRKVPQAEGISVGPDDAIYVVSEPNLLYRFDRARHDTPPGHAAETHQ